MPTPNEKLAESLSALRALQNPGRRVFRSNEISRTHRQRLVANGFLQEVIKGWFISSNPGARQGDSTPWYASFWEFCARYCEARFGATWHLSPEQSLLLHAENTVVPAQIVVYTPGGANNATELLYGSSIYDLKQPTLPPASDVVVRDGLRLYSPAAALIKVPASFFSRYPIESQVLLASFGEASELLRRLLEGGNSVVAGRLAGALRWMHRDAMADEIVSTMKSTSYDVRENNPFVEPRAFATPSSATAPIVGRIRAMWQATRQIVVESFPPPPGLPTDRVAYAKDIDEVYKSDAYHSLSIEGYSVTPELIERVRTGNWHPDHSDEDRRSRDTLAARGYWQTFQSVKEVVGDVIAGANPGTLTRAAHRDWYRELFQPCVVAGLLPPGALAGYRNDAVYLRTSRYVPPRWEAVRDAMPALFDLLEHETEPSVRAVLGHWFFGYVHPYPDGNGRLARFLMNAMLASGGYPWTVIRVDDRNAYLAALDSASIDVDIRPFARFIAERVATTMSDGPNALAIKTSQLRRPRQ